MAMSKKKMAAIEKKEVKKEFGFVYFRDHAADLGCTNVNELGDLAVWDYIIANQAK